MEDLSIAEEDKNDLVRERYALAIERIGEIPEESICTGRLQDYFEEMAAFVLLMDQAWEMVESGRLRQMTLEELQVFNRKLYEDILPEHYQRSYANPDYAADCLGEPIGQMFSFVSAELRGMIAAAFEQDKMAMVIRMELLLEVYQACVCAVQEQTENARRQEGNKTCRRDSADMQIWPDAAAVQQILYWYVSDYFEPETYGKVAKLVCSQQDFASRIILESDLNDLRYLYYYGEYVTDNELRTAKHLNQMPEEKIRLMADTYTEGYRIGFEVGNKDISIKKTVNIRYCLGFERLIRQAVHNFDQIGLRPTIYRAGTNIFQGRSVNKTGFFGANPNKQFDYDHREDLALVLDKLLVERRLDCMKNAFEQYRDEAKVHGGPAVMEIFGEKPFVPQTKAAACRLSEKQQKLSVEYASKAGMLQNEYIPGEERSFTIIAWPVPEIGEDFPEIFQEVVARPHGDAGHGGAFHTGNAVGALINGFGNCPNGIGDS